MEVDGDRVRELDAVEEVPPAARGQQATAVRRIDVEPHPQRFADRRDPSQRVDRAEVGRPGRGDDGHRHQPVLEALVERQLQVLDAHPVRVVTRHRNDGRGREPQQAPGLLDAEVPVVGDQDPQLFRLDLVPGECACHEPAAGPGGWTGSRRW